MTDALVEQLLATEPGAAADPSSIRVVHAPGRVNLIGEHTDYNDGFVLPAAIDLGITIAFVPTDDRRVELTLAATGESVRIDLHTIEPASGRWIDYVAGTAWALSGGERPDTDTMRLAQLAQRAENEHVGVACGLMDQFAVAFGVADHALLLDCRSLAHGVVPIPEGIRLVICDSGAPRALADSAYNVRRAECARAVAALRTLDPSVHALRDVAPELLEAGRDRLTDVEIWRARHVITENRRVLDTVEALAEGDLVAVGDALAASHRSLRDDFEVSSAPLDALVDIASAVDGVIGARLTGAGFGGCTINLVHEDAVAALRSAVASEYPQRTGLTATVYAVRTASGVGRLQ